MDFRLPIGNKVKVGNITLNGNGRVDRKEGTVPQNGLASIEDPRVESFISSRGLESLGENWRGDLKPDYDTREITAACNGWPRTDDTSSGQFLILDRKGHKITLQTQDIHNSGFFNHWIQASFDNQGQINPKTITEWVSD